MTRFIVSLTEEQRAALDLYRGDHRLKSNAEAVRHWLDGYVEGPRPKPLKLSEALDGSPIYAENRVRQREGRKR